MRENLVIMLVDDNKIDLFIHGEVLKRIPVITKVLQYTFAGEAINYLEENTEQSWPDVILLDIHMPIMNGFDFLMKYEKLPQALREKCKVIMVSSSLDSGDLDMAKTNPEVFAFLEKPMNTDKLKDLLASVS